MSEKTAPPPPYYPEPQGQQTGYPVDPNFHQQPPQSYPQPAPQNYGYPPQQVPLPNYGYPPQQVPPPQGQTATAVIVQTHTSALGSGPSSCYCPKCQETVISRCEYDNSSMAWIICMVLFVAGFCFLITWFICWIPFCIDDMKTVVHRCPKCNSHLGTYKRAGF